MSSTALPNKARLRPDEVAVYMDRSKRTVYRWIAEGLLPRVLTPGGRIQIKKEDVEKFDISSVNIEILSTDY